MMAGQLGQFLLAAAVSTLNNDLSFFFFLHKGASNALKVEVHCLNRKKKYMWSGSKPFEHEQILYI